MLTKMKEVMDEVVVLKWVVAQGVTWTSSTPAGMFATSSRIEIPKPSMFKGSTNAREIDNFIWGIKQYFKAIDIVDEALKVDNATLFLMDTTSVWWRRRHADIKNGAYIIANWEYFKKELRKQFYPDNAAHEARAKLRRLTQRGSIQEYVKELSEVLLEIPD